MTASKSTFSAPAPKAPSADRHSRRLALSIASLALIAAGGCAGLKPAPLTSDEIKAFEAADRELIQRDVEALQGALSLEEAIARALKYNLDRRVRVMEEAVALGQLDVGSYDMLPKLVASAGYRERDSDLISRSKDSVTGLPSLANPYISSDKLVNTQDLSFTWSLLDFGQSYYATKQNADRVLVAAERRRKAMHLLIQDVRTAFWRVASAQKLRGDVNATIAAAEDALNDSRMAGASRLRNPIDALRYQRQVLENLRLLEAIDQELSTARVELATLTNLPLAQNVTVVEPDTPPNAKWLDIPVEQMEEQALAQNADLREAFYNARIASQETRRALLRVFPGLSFSYANKVSDDSYLINQHWQETGMQLSLNLLGILSAPAQMRLAEAGIAVADQRRMATQMAVLSQVHIGRLQYANAFRQYERADAIARVDGEISAHIANRERAQTQTKLDRVANQTSFILSQLRRYQALAQVHAAASKLQATLGLEPVIDGSRDMPLAALSQVVANSLSGMDQARLPSPAAAVPAAEEAVQVVPVAAGETDPAPAEALTPAPVALPQESAVPTPVVTAEENVAPASAVEEAAAPAVAEAVAAPEAVLPQAAEPAPVVAVEEAPAPAEALVEPAAAPAAPEAAAAPAAVEAPAPEALQPQAAEPAPVVAVEEAPAPAVPAVEEAAAQVAPEAAAAPVAVEAPAPAPVVAVEEAPAAAPALDVVVEESVALAPAVVLPDAEGTPEIVEGLAAPAPDSES